VNLSWRLIIDVPKRVRLIERAAERSLDLCTDALADAEGESIQAGPRLGDDQIAHARNSIRDVITAAVSRMVYRVPATSPAPSL
jgi:hypothetical protein